MNTYTETNSQGFEITTCGRCCGTGKYSFNLMHGDRCYGCGGSGKIFTKRGSAARLFYVESQKRPIADLKVGEYLWDDMFGHKAKWMPILSIAPSQSCQLLPNGEKRYYVDIETKRGALGVFPDSTVRSIRDEAHRTELLAIALAYQDTLGVNGKPLKRAAKKVTA
jgi:hypothetical protein